MYGMVRSHFVCGLMFFKSIGQYVRVSSDGKLGWAGVFFFCPRPLSDSSIQRFEGRVNDCIRDGYGGDHYS